MRWWLRYSKTMDVWTSPKLMIVNPFFRFKIDRFKAMAQRVAHT
jgi:hypothetical protein